MDLVGEVGEIGDGGSGSGLSERAGDMGGIGLVDREEGEYLGEGRGLRVVVEDVVLADNGGELGASYVGGGTKDALTRSLVELPASSAAWRSLAYLSWNVRRILISIATALRSAEIPFNLGLGG